MFSLCGQKDYRIQRRGTVEMAESNGRNILPVNKKLRSTTQQFVKLKGTLPTKNNLKSEQETSVDSSDSSISDEEDYNSSESSESSESSATSLHLPGRPEDGSETSEETDSSDCSDSSDNSNSSSESDIEDLITMIKSNRTHIEEFRKGILNKNSPDTTNNLPLFNKTAVDSLFQNNDTKNSTEKEKKDRPKKN